VIVLANITVDIINSSTEVIEYHKGMVVLTIMVLWYNIW